MDADVLERCQQVVGYRFNDLDLLSLALTHASIAATRFQSNERLEFLGDSVLGLTVCDDLFRRCEDLMEGELTKVKSSVVSRQTCAEVAEELGIGEMLFLGKGMPSREGLPSSVQAAVLEAMIGAIYIDGGMEPARKFILEHLEPHIVEALENQHQKNYKSLLQQLAQRRWGTTPEYQLLDEKGPDHSKCFEIAVSIDGRHFPSAWGKNKKESEQLAAYLALEELGVLTEETEEAETATEQ